MAGEVLVLLAHPALHRSRVNARVAAALRALPGVTVHDLYDAYPDLHIDIPAEQARVAGHGALVWLHPVYWYSTPAILKEWQDEVLAFNWAYGPDGGALRGKRFGSVVSTGGRAEAYAPAGLNRYPLRDLLRPAEATAHLCGLRYTPPFAIQGTHRLADAEIQHHAAQAARYVEALRDGTLDGHDFGPSSLANGAISAEAVGA
jgi:glutathione-regulated potassium-efflux system ancillary protein KefG